MPGYFGTEMQQRLQAQAEASVDFIDATPGACQTGRTMGCDDPDQLVSASNVPSRRMVESCGLRPEPGLVCGIATSNDSARFTR